MIFSFLFHLKHSFINNDERHFCAILSLQHTKMISFDEITDENQTKHNPNWPCIPDQEKPTHY